MVEKIRVECGGHARAAGLAGFLRRCV